MRKILSNGQLKGFARLFLVAVVLVAILGNASWVSPAAANPPQPGQPGEITPDPTVKIIINAVNTNTLTRLVGDLSGVNSPVIDGEPYTFITRYTLAEIPDAKATQYVYNYLHALNLDVEFQDWTATDEEGTVVTSRNIVAEQPGNNTANPCIYLVIGHVDSINNDVNEDPMIPAPGADDDATGTAAVLMLASILKNYTFGCTIRYVVASGEELGLLGGTAYAERAAAAGDPIKGVMALDMMGYKTNTNQKFELISRVGAPGIPDRLLTAMVIAVNTAYNIGLVPVGDQSNAEDADHAAFWASGFPAILVIQDSTNLNPNYHKASDTLDKLNPTYYTKMVKVVAGALAHLAVPATNYHLYLPLTMKRSLQMEYIPQQ